MEMDNGQGFRSQRGSAVTSVAALVGLVGLLYVVYINLQVTGEQATKGMETQAVSQGVACMSNRQAIGLSITTWSVTHPGVEPTLEDLQTSLKRLPQHTIMALPRQPGVALPRRRDCVH